MLYTIAEADKYSRTTLLRGVIETIVAESPVLNLLPFAEILGNSLTYNRESTLGNANYYAPGDTWSESTGTLNQITVALKILGGDADIDKFLSLTRSNEQDLKSEMIAMKAKAVARQFQDTFIYGSSTADTKSFDGLHVLTTALAAGQRIHVGTGATGAAGTLSKLDELMDAIPGGPSALMMGRRARRGIAKLARSQGWNLQTVPIGDLGHRALSYNGIPMFVNDFMTATEVIASGEYSAKTGGATESVFAMRFGEDGLHGLEAGTGIQVDDVGTLETKDATRTRVKWYMNLALMSTVMLGRLDGISSADWTN